MLFAVEVAGEVSAAIVRFDPFNWFILAFTVLIGIGFVRLIMERPKKNLFAIGFTAAALGLFLLMDVVMLMKHAEAVRLAAEVAMQ